MELLVVLGRHLRRLDGDTLDGSAVPVLATLDALGASRPGSVACALSLDASTVSRHMRQLEERGLVERTDDPDDGRASLIGLTPKGAAALAEHRARRRRLIATFLESWDEADRAVLRDLAARLVLELEPALVESDR